MYSEHRVVYNRMENKVNSKGHLLDSALGANIAGTCFLELIKGTFTLIIHCFCN